MCISIHLASKSAGVELWIDAMIRKCTELLAGIVLIDSGHILSKIVVDESVIETAVRSALVNMHRKTVSNET